MGLESVMTTDVVTVALDDTVLDVAAVFRERDVGSAVVLNADDEIAGIVTDRDLVVFGQEFVETLEQTLVNQVLSPVVFTVSPDTDTHELARMMREEGVRRVPVVEDGDLRGIVTLDDLVVVLAEDLENLAALIRAESPSRMVVD
ncbi:CBS domain-containing protein [Haloglomus salinum]|jgi:CBS domain-containing protein|uniref:CBS domain-containing protein n=1 Tax=Haloglomus salinum TaxID=2962673 RepID=UPI0020C9F8C0|nr:CBS domain-containing protein [Haloglomus salinum]